MVYNRVQSQEEYALLCFTVACFRRVRQRKPHPTTDPRSPNTRATHPDLSCTCERNHEGPSSPLSPANCENAALSVQAGHSLYKSDFHAKTVAVGKYGSGIESMLQGSIKRASMVLESPPFF